MLTTQYLEEADHLADEIVVVDKGKVIAAGTPTQLKDQAGRASVVVTLTHAADLDRAAELMRSCCAEVHVERGSRRLTAQAERARRHDPDRRASSRPAASSSTTSGSPGPASTTCSCTSPATAPRPTTTTTTDPTPEGVAAVTAVQTVPARRRAAADLAAVTAAGVDGIVWRNLLHIRRMPEMLLDVTVQSVMFVLLFAYVFGGAIAVQGANYKEFLLPGIMVQTMVVLLGHRRHGAHQRPAEGVRRPVQVAAGPPVGGARRAEHLQPDPLQHRRRRDGADRPAHRLAHPQRRRRRRPGLRAAAAVW